MKRKICFLLVLCMMLGLAAGCGRQEEKDSITSLEQLNEEGRKIGVAVDTADDELVRQFFPLAQAEYFSDNITAYTAVGQGKVDAYLYGRIYLETALRNGLTGMKILEENVGEGNTAAIAVSPVTKIPELKEKINAFLKEIREDASFDRRNTRITVENGRVVSISHLYVP